MFFNHRGILGLNGLSKISDQVAQHLSKQLGNLHLDSLTEISIIAAEHLSFHRANPNGCGYQVFWN